MSGNRNPLFPSAVNQRLDSITRSIVKLPHKGGQGVLVTGGFVLTAAHCIEARFDGAMALDDAFEIIETQQGESIRLTVAAVEPVSDIAALARPDPERLPNDSDLFRNFLNNTEEVRLRFGPLNLDERMPVWIRSRQDWVEGYADLFKTDANQVWITSEQQIDDGASGGPIIDELGELVGIVSHACEQHGDSECNGTVPLPHLSLPIWVVKAIRHPVD